MPRKQWKEITLNEEQQQSLYRSWGIEFIKKQQFSNANLYLDKAVELKNDDCKALFYRSICKSNLGNEALSDAQAALDLDGNQLTNLRVCDALYDCNQFEICKAELCIKWKKFSGQKAEPFLRKMEIVEANLLDSVGKYAGPFLKQNAKLLDKIGEKNITKKKLESRPLWKTPQDNNECDVLSIVEEEKKLHKREQAKSVRCNRFLNQVYFQKGWKDVNCLMKLKTNRTLLLDQTTRTTSYLSEIVNTNYDIVHKNLKMLQARNPLYTQRYKMYPNPKLAKKTKEDHLHRVQYQTRRDMFNILKTCTGLRKKGNLKKLVKYAEKQMGDYIILKTQRVMPRKFEFINEIYNTIALAYCDKLEVPENLMLLPIKERMPVLLDLPMNRDRDKAVPYVFGDKSTYQVPGAPDLIYISYKKITARLKDRLQFAEFPIEKCYLLHELARNHLNQSKSDEARDLGRKIINEGNLCGNRVWMFLGALIICKSDAVHENLEIIKNSLIEASEIANGLNDQRINFFVETCAHVNQINLKNKRSLSEGLLSMSRELSKLSQLRRSFTGAAPLFTSDEQQN